MKKIQVKDVVHEKCVRKTFSKIGDFVEIPNLLKVQKDSYEWFIKEGLGEVLKDISPIADVKVRLINRETGEIKEQEIYLGDFPLMTDSGTFVINGAERVVVSQLVRSPGCYYDSSYDKVGKKLYTATVMPIRGAWIEYETDSNDVFWVRIDRTRKLPVTTLLRAIGLISDDQIRALFGEENLLETTIQKDSIKTGEEALIEIYKKLRPGELPTVEDLNSIKN